MCIPIESADAISHYLTISLKPCEGPDEIKQGDLQK